MNSIDRAGINARAKFFRGLSDPSRLSILEVLSNCPMSVMEIVNATGLSQPNVSSHLACLRDCGLITMQPQGRYVICQISDPRVNQLLSLASSLLADVAQGVYECTRYSQNGEQSVYKAEG